MSAERGYSRAMHESGERGCVCPEDFDHDGKCQNSLRGKKEAKCPPCSQGWHHPYPCDRYVEKGFKIASTQCDRCGWDSAEHPMTEAMRALQVDARTRYARNT